MSAAGRSLTLSDRHFDAGTIGDFLLDPETLTPAGRLELSKHLTLGCRLCWAAVDLLLPVATVRPSLVPLREALIHLRSRESRGILHADLLAALERARETSTELAVTLIEEALHLGMTAAEITAEPLEEVAGLVRDLGELLVPREVQPLEILYQARHAYLHAVMGEPASAYFLQAASKVVQTRCPDRRVYVAIADAHAASALAAGDVDDALKTLRQGLVLLEDGCFLRRAEQWASIAHVLADSGRLDQLPGAMFQVLRGYEPLKGCGDPFFETATIFKHALLKQQLAGRLPEDHRLRRSGVPWAAEELDAAGELFARHTDTFTQGHRHLCLARLYAFFDAARARRAYLGAIRDFRACEAEECGDSAFVELALLERQHADAGAGLTVSISREASAEHRRILSELFPHGKLVEEPVN